MDFPCPCHALKDEMPAKSTTDKQRVFLERAARLAMKSTMTHQHGCVLVLNGEIIAEGFNHVSTHMYHRFSVHSEVDALQKAKRYRHQLADAEMYVVRIASGKFDHCLKYSKPCSGCQTAILKYGVKKVYYSTNDEFEQVWKTVYG